MQRLTLAIFCLAAPTMAFAKDAIPDDKTPYAFELNVTDAQTPVGAARIYADIRRQAVRFCRTLETPSGGVTRKVRACRGEIVENAVRQVAAPRVTALWSADQSDKRYANR